MGKQASVQYYGTHEQHPVDESVIRSITSLVNRLNSEFNGISAQMRFYDSDNVYSITFAWEGKVFLVLVYYPNATANTSFQDEESLKYMCFAWLADVHVYHRLSRVVDMESGRVAALLNKARRIIDENKKNIYKGSPLVFETHCDLLLS